LVATEAFVLRSAALAGLEAADVRLDNFGGRTVLVVTRFDREAKDGSLIRLHQEDGCQALGNDPSGIGKYQSVDGTASYRRLAEVLAKFSRDRLSELRALGAMMTFTVAVGNTDAHLRNHAFLHSGGAISLAPIFDAAPTAEFAAARRLALWVNDQPLLGAVTYRRLLDELETWGLDRDVADELVSTTLSRLAAAYPEAARMIPEAPPAIVATCQARTENLLHQR
jgi:serine/threonine-protein kinase HipA